MTQPRAADDFAAIRARMKELAQEAAEASAENAAQNQAPPSDRDRRQRDRRDGHPPPWAPTIFAKPQAGRR